MSNKFKVCMNNDCEQYNMVMLTNVNYCPYCLTRLQFPVITKMPK